MKPSLETTPAKVVGETVVIVQGPPWRSTVPVKVSAPVLTTSPKVTSPPIWTLFANVRAVVESLAIVGSRMQRIPAPKAASWPA